MQTPSPRPAKLKRGRGRKSAEAQTSRPDGAVFRGRIFPWLFLLPTMVILALFLYYPALQTLRLSVYRSNIVLGNEYFVGLENMAELLSSPVYHQVFAQTLIFALLVVILGLSTALGLAWLASRPIHGGRFYRLMLIYPYALSPAIAGTLWLFLFNPEIGVVNQLLMSVAGLKPRWLDDPMLAFGLVTLAAVWKGLGYNVVFYLAAIQNLPTEVMEAAEIDGATPMQTFMKIMLPLLSPMTFFLVFVNVVYALFDSFGLVDILTKGGPVFGQAGITTFLVYQLYLDGFTNFKTGLAAAQAVLLLILVAGITILQFRVNGRKVHYGG